MAIWTAAETVAGGVANAPQESQKKIDREREKQIWIFVIFICEMVATENNN